MAGEQLHREILGDERGEPASARAARWLRAHPMAAGLVAAPAAILLLVGAGIVAVQALRPPPAPALTITADQSAAPSPAWRPGQADRPDGPVVLTAPVTLRRVRASHDPVTVLGIAGPGIVRSDNPSVALPTGTDPVPATLRAVIDCDAVPAAGPTGAYGLRTRSPSASPTDAPIVPAGAIAEQWRATIRLGCASWAARRDLTVTEVTARVDPQQPRIELTLTVANAGSRPAVLISDSADRVAIRVAGGTPIAIPPHASATTTLPVVIGRCDTTIRPFDGPSPLVVDPVLSDRIGLVGWSGSPGPAGPGSRADQATAIENGVGPTGVVLAPEAGARLQAALRQACGGIGPVVALISPGTVRYDRARRLLAVPVLLDLAPGRVRSLQLRPDPEAADPSLYQLLWTATGDLTPDRTGQLRLLLHYRAPASGACPSQGGRLPGFIATLQVPDGGGDRQVSYYGFVDLGQDPSALPLLCAG